VTRGFDLDPKINGFPGLIVERLYVKFGDPSCIGLKLKSEHMHISSRHSIPPGDTNKYDMIRYDMVD